MAQGFSTISYVPQRIAVVPNAFNQNNFTAASRVAIAVVADASANTKGAWTTVIAALSYDAYGIQMRIHGLRANTSINATLIDIGYNNGSDIALITDINIGDADTPMASLEFLGINIPAGSTVRARVQSDTGSQSVSTEWSSINTLRVIGITENNWVTYGADTSTSKGTLVSAANAAFGTWTQIGTTSQDHNLWQVSVGPNTSALGFFNTLYQLGYGPNSGAVTVLGEWMGYCTNTEDIGTFMTNQTVGGYVASGTKIWVRIASGDTAQWACQVHGGG